MIYLAAFAIMMAMGNMNAYAKVGAKHGEFHMNDKGRVEVRYDRHHHDDMYGFNGHKMSKHERKMMEERRRMEERRMMEERRRMEEMRRMETRRHHHVVHHHNSAGNVVAGVAAGVAVAAIIGALAH